MGDADDVRSLVSNIWRYILLGWLRFLGAIQAIRWFNSPKAWMYPCTANSSTTSNFVGKWISRFGALHNLFSLLLYVPYILGGICIRRSRWHRNSIYSKLQARSKNDAKLPDESPDDEEDNQVESPQRGRIMAEWASHPCFGCIPCLQVCRYWLGTVLFYTRTYWTTGLISRTISYYYFTPFRMMHGWWAHITLESMDHMISCSGAKLKEDYRCLPYIYTQPRMLWYWQELKYSWRAWKIITET